MSKILFIDDDKYFANEYLENLKAHHDVLVCYEAEVAVRLIHETADLEGAIIDVMMTPPAGREHETHDGFTTGVWIVDQCREVIASRRIAVMFFTNRALAYVRAEVAYMDLDPQLCEISAKDSIDADDLPHTIAKLIARR